MALAYAENRKLPTVDQFAKIVIAGLGSDEGTIGRRRDSSPWRMLNNAEV
ncbi:hypothetical protein ACIQGO_40565 [Streptomyces shenzhenensis]